MDEATRSLVVVRANHRCEYCQLPASASPLIAFHIEHVRAKQHRGGDEPDNLCWSCAECNLQKGPNQSAYDPATDQLVRLFNPRTDHWSEHFHRDGPLLVGDSPEGRATVELLEINQEYRVELRQELLANDEF